MVRALQALFARTPVTDIGGSARCPRCHTPLVAVMGAGGPAWRCGCS